MRVKMPAFWDAAPFCVVDILTDILEVLIASIITVMNKPRAERLGEEKEQRGFG
jgi:hypothetical protein